LEWIKTKVHFDQPAQEIVLTDYVHQVEHLVARIERLDQAVVEAARSAPPQMRAVIEALQALRGIAQVTAVTIVTELGQISRFAKARQLMGYSGLVPSEASSGERERRGAITKTGSRAADECRACRVVGAGPEGDACRSYGRAAL
jgi:transposase